MHRGQRHSAYRKSMYKKRGIKLPLIISLIAVAAVFVLFLAVGNLLHGKTEEPYGDKTQSSADSTDKYTPNSVRKVGAYPLPLLEQGSQFSSRLSAIPSEANSVCIALNRPDGTLLYRSSLAPSLSMLTTAAEATALETSLLAVDRNGFYTSAILYIPDSAQSSSLLWDVELAMWSSVAAEAVQSGVGDILLVCRSASLEDLTAIKSLSASIKQKSTNATVGLLIPESVMASDGKETLIDGLAKSFDYLALDTTLDREGAPLTYIEGRVKSMQYMIIYYGMRVLLPNGADATEAESFIAKALEYSADSWMIAP